MSETLYTDCSGCGLMFNTSTEKEQLENHDCDTDEALSLSTDGEEKENPYFSYSLDSLSSIAKQYAEMLGNGRTTLGNGDNLGEAYEQVCEAIERREQMDYCKHGNFRWTDHDISCIACEME